MAKIGIFFGTDTGRTRLTAKQIAKKLGEIAAAPVNIGRATVADFAAHEALILGTPTLGEGDLPGLSTGLGAESWEEFLPRLEGVDLAGKVVAIYGLGDQEKYPAEFCDAMALIHDRLLACGARIVGDWPVKGYSFAASQAVVGDNFVGLALDQINQAGLSEERIDTWLAQVLPELKIASGNQ
ncbi:MAG: flavodoxin [Sulfurisoma sp.]|nr:flavodoxin [Sulfurisoma sp.]